MAEWWDVRPTLNRKADDDARKLNFIWRQIIDPCDAPITVWAWAFWPAFKRAVLAWYEVSIIQIFYSWLRPRFRGIRTRSYRHWGGGTRGKRPGSKHGRLNPFTFDPNEWIGDRLSRWSEWDNPLLLPGELGVWTITELIEHVLFYWQVFDLAKDFLYDWASAVASTKYCHARDDAVLLATAIGYPQLGIFDWEPMGILAAIKMRKIAFWNGYGVAGEFGPGYLAATASCTSNIANAPGSWVEQRVVCLTGPRQGLQSMVHYDIAPGETQQIGVQAICMGGEVWIAEIKCNGLFFIGDPTINFHAPWTETP